MSDPHIALVAEGPTDHIVIEAALKAILQRPFVLTQLQPEPTLPQMGNGWGGVFKWCQEFRKRGSAQIEDDPTLNHFDLVIVHLDADVANKSYADYGDSIVQSANELQPLPCAHNCPPPSDTVAALETVLLSWMGLATIGPKSLFCIPSKASEAWLAPAVLPANHALLTGIECNVDLETGLAQLPKSLRVRKTTRVYRTHAGKVTSQWNVVTNHCEQAVLFEQKLQAVAQTFPA